MILADGASLIGINEQRVAPPAERLRATRLPASGLMQVNAGTLDEWRHGYPPTLEILQ